jgi:hypothetical protein
MNTTTTKTPVTIFIGGTFGPTKYEGNLLEHGRRAYAQYPDAPFVKFVPKGKRNPRGWVEGFQPYCVVLSGHGLPVGPESWLDEMPESTSGMKCERSRYASCDSRYETDFNTRLNRYLAENPDKLIADYRWNKSET